MAHALRLLAAPAERRRGFIALIPWVTAAAVILRVLQWFTTGWPQPLYWVMAVLVGLNAVWAAEYTRRGSAPRPLQLLIGFTTAGCVVVFLLYIVTLVAAIL